MNALIEALVSPHVAALLNSTEKTMLNTDACNKQVRCVVTLKQND